MGVVIGQGITVSPVPNWFTSFLLASIWPTIHDIQLFEIWLWKNQCHIIIIVIVFIVIVIVIYCCYHHYHIIITIIVIVVLVIIIINIISLLLIFLFIYLFIYLFIFFFFGGGGGGAAVYNGRLYIQENWWWIKMKLVNMGRCKNDYDNVYR